MKNNIKKFNLFLNENKVDAHEDQVIEKFQEIFDQLIGLDLEFIGVNVDMVDMVRNEYNTIYGEMTERLGEYLLGFLTWDVSENIIERITKLYEEEFLTLEKNGDGIIYYFRTEANEDGRLLHELKHSPNGDFFDIYELNTFEFTINGPNTTNISKLYEEIRLQ